MKSTEIPIEVTIVMPCLNEADTLANCIRVAQKALDDNNLNGEIIISDNGSSDGSQDIAVKNGARLVNTAERGYGAALMGGIAAARGEFIIMGDADESYDFSETPVIVSKLRQGYELVQGCRLPSGGGEIMPGAMPLLHKYIGNPLFSLLAKWWFKVPINDIYCGLRGFTKTFYNRIDQRCTGMEFAVEMIIKASLSNSKIAEFTTTLHQDGRKSHAPHLKTFRDGWRTLRFFLLLTPKWVFLVPGMILVVSGLLGYLIALPGLTLFGITFGAHSLLFASLAIICGFQSIVFSIHAKTFAIMEGLLPEDRKLNRFYEIVNLEKGIIIATITLFSGLYLLTLSFGEWQIVNFGPLDYAHTMKLVIPGATLTTLGLQILLSSFFISMLGIHRK